MLTCVTAVFLSWLETLDCLIENVPDEFMALVLFAAEAPV